MGKLSAPKQGHERSIKGSSALKEVCERPFSADGIADQQDQKIKEIIAAEATSSSEKVPAAPTNKDKRLPSQSNRLEFHMVP
jgi:hypothetical protein